MSGAEVVRAEARALVALADGMDGSFDHAVDLFAGVSGRVVCTGMGKSGHVARKVAATLASTGTPATFVHPAEAAHGDLGMIVPGDGIFAFSRSGLTFEIEPIIERAKALAGPVVLASAGARTGLALHADAVLRLPDLDEAWGRVPTVSTVMQMALGDALAVALAERRGFTGADFKALHPGGALGRAA